MGASNGGSGDGKRAGGQTKAEGAAAAGELTVSQNGTYRGVEAAGEVGCIGTLLRSATEARAAIRALHNSRCRIAPNKDSRTTCTVSEICTAGQTCPAAIEVVQHPYVARPCLVMPH